MRPVDPVWQGLGKGRGRLRRRVLEIEATGRGSATRPRTVRVLLPSGATGAAAVSTGPGHADGTGRPVAAVLLRDPTAPGRVGPEPDTDGATPAATGRDVFVSDTAEAVG